MLFLQVLIPIILAFFSAEKKNLEVVTWKVSASSILQIDGVSNVSDFQCSSHEYSGKDHLTQKISDDGTVGQWTGEVHMNSSYFDCKNPMLTKDFKETLQIDTYPTIKVKFLDLVLESETINQKNLQGEVEITLVGVSKKYPISCVFLAQNGGKALLSGERKLTFTDFGIDPPVKLFGAIKVRDEITVNFSLILEQV